MKTHTHTEGGGGHRYGLQNTCQCMEKSTTNDLPTGTLALTLIKTEYWDRAGGGGNISYDW